MTGNAAPQTASEFFQAELIAQIYSPGEILLNLAIAFVLAMMVALHIAPRIAVSVILSRFCSR